MIMILVCLVLLALPLLWGKIKSTGGVGWLFLPNLFPPLPMKCSYMAINIKMIVSHGLNSWKEGKRKKKEEGYALCKFTFSGLSRFNQMKKTLFKKEIVWLNQLNEQVQDFPQCWSITFTRGTAMGNKIFYGNGLR